MENRFFTLSLLPLPRSLWLFLMNPGVFKLQFRMGDGAADLYRNVPCEFVVRVVLDERFGDRIHTFPLSMNR